MLFRQNLLADQLSRVRFLTKAKKLSRFYRFEGCLWHSLGKWDITQTYKSYTLLNNLQAHLLPSKRLSCQRAPKLASEQEAKQWPSSRISVGPSAVQPLYSKAPQRLPQVSLIMLMTYLPILCKIFPPDMRRNKTSMREYDKFTSNTSLAFHNDLLNQPRARLKSRKPPILTARKFLEEEFDLMSMTWMAS